MAPVADTPKGYVVGQSITDKFKYEPIQTLTADQMAVADFYQNCVFRSTTAGIAGGVMGVAFGIFMGAMEPASLSSPAPLGDQPSKSAWQVFKGMVRSTGQRSSCAPTTAVLCCDIAFQACAHNSAMCIPPGCMQDVRTELWNDRIAVLGDRVCDRGSQGATRRVQLVLHRRAHRWPPGQGKCAPLPLLLPEPPYL